MLQYRTGFRRRILIEPAPGRVVAELEDDYHRMAVRLDHAGAIVNCVASEMKRGPWTTCPGAMAVVAETFTGVALTDFPKRGGKFQNCTHLYDLALFAAAHADEAAPLAYEVFVSDPEDGQRQARLWREGILTLDWLMAGDGFLAPTELAGLTVMQLGEWIAQADRPTAEAGRILRWATILALGRSMDIPTGISGTVFPAGTCYTFQPERAREATRRPGAAIDFSLPGNEPMADRAAAFGSDGDRPPGHRYSARFEQP